MSAPDAPGADGRGSPDRAADPWRGGRLGGPAAGARRASRAERLSTERIVDTALGLMRSGGYEAVSMRSVARSLGTGPASLYAHVRSKEELDQLLVDRIAEQLVVPVPDPQRWDEQIKQMMREGLDLYRAHPGSARANMGTIPTGRGAMRTAEGLLALCRAGGVPDQVAAWFCDLISLYTVAVAVEETIWVERARAAGGAGEPAEFEEMDVHFASHLESLPASEFPLLTSMARVMTNGDGRRRFEFGLSVLVAGLKAVAEQDQQT